MNQVQDDEFVNPPFLQTLLNAEINLIDLILYAAFPPCSPAWEMMEGENV